MKSTLPDDALNQIFREARTHGAWLDKPVSDETLRQLYDLMKWGPTSANGSPGRLVFLRTPEAKERLRPALAPGNVEKTMTAPVTAIIAYDLLFFENCLSYSLTRPACVICLHRIRNSLRRPLSATLPFRAPTSLSRRAHLGSTVAQCQVLITRRWMKNFSARAKNAKGASKSFFPQATLSRISYAILVTETQSKAFPESATAGIQRRLHASMRGCAYWF